MKLIYVYDALCGWCYGFSPVITEFAQKHQAELEVEVISGGMITGERIGPIGEVAAYIGEAYKTVEQHCGLKFGESFLKDVLEEGSAIFTSIPPSIALSIVKVQKPEHSLSFAARLQKAIYFDGLPPAEIEGYGALAAEFGLDAKSFVADMQKEVYLESAEKDFQLSRELGVAGFPSIFLADEQSMVKLSSGYLDLEGLETNFEKGKETILRAKKENE